MNKKILVVGIVCFMLAILTSGCFEQKNEGGSEAPKTVTMTAREFFMDLDMPVVSQTNVVINFKSLNDGDTLIIQDTISDVTYDSDYDTTTIIFQWIEGGGNLSTNIAFEGNIMSSYQVGDNVNITVKIKHVTFSYEGAAWDMEIFEEQWESTDYFTSHIETGNPYKPLPQSCIVKV